MSKDGLLRGNPAWKKGFCPNPKGRPRQLLRRIEESLAESEIDPVQEILKLLADDEVLKVTKLKSWIELLPYLYPKAKDETSAVDAIRDELAALTKEQLIERMEQDLTRLRASG